MNQFKTAFVATLAVSAAACGGIDVKSDYNPNVDFSTYQTFAMLDEADGGGSVDQFVDQRLKAGIAQVITEKGWRQVDNVADADATVGYQFTTDERVSYQTVNSGWGGYGYGYGGWYGPAWGGGMSTSSTTENRYQVGQLIIAVFDHDKEEMMFVGTGSKTLSDDNLTPEESQQRINDAVRTILRDFPPGS